MEGSLFLSKATSWYQTDSLLLQQAHAVKHVRNQTFLLWVHTFSHACVKITSGYPAADILQETLALSMAL